jgi:hypothetical protein
LGSCEKIDLTSAGSQVAANFSSPHQAFAEADGDLKVAATDFFTACEGLGYGKAFPGREEMAG